MCRNHLKLDDVSRYPQYRNVECPTLVCSSSKSNAVALWFKSFCSNTAAIRQWQNQLQEYWYLLRNSTTKTQCRIQTLSCFSLTLEAKREPNCKLALTSVRHSELWNSVRRLEYTVNLRNASSLSIVRECESSRGARTRFFFVFFFLVVVFFFFFVSLTVP